MFRKGKLFKERKEKRRGGKGGEFVLVGLKEKEVGRV
jgi:hypothetical protein